MTFDTVTSVRGIRIAAPDRARIVVFRFMDQSTPESRSSIVNVPVNNFIDNFTMSKGKHTLAAGANWRIIQNNRSSDQLSYSQGNTNEYWLVNGGAIAGQSVPGSPQSLDPGGFGFPSVDSGFSNSYNIAAAMLTGWFRKQPDTTTTKSRRTAPPGRSYRRVIFLTGTLSRTRWNSTFKTGGKFFPNLP